MTRTISLFVEDQEVEVEVEVKVDEEEEEESCRQDKMCESDERLCAEFLREYAIFSKEFDHLSEDSFSGEEMNQLSQDFLAKSHQHQCFLKIPYSFEGAKFPQCTNSEALNEDLRLVSGETRNYRAANECASILAALYRRACQGYYQFIVLKKSRQNRESDRWRAVEFARHAIRYDPTSFEANYWYMIALGWQLDVTSNPRERALVARTFFQATKNCIELEPNDPLAYNLLGRYYYNVAGLSWIEKTVAEKLLGAPMNGTYQDAEREFRRAHQLRDDWLPCGLWMARVLLAQKRPIEEVKQWIDLSLSMECREPSSEIELRELLDLKAKLKLK